MLEMQEMRARLQDAAGPEAAEMLASLCRELGFHEPARSATNLELLMEAFGGQELTARAIPWALEAADPDLALNYLERLCGCHGGETVRAALEHIDGGSRLLHLLGASPFLGGILCRRKQYLEGLFCGGEFLLRKNHARMLAELRASTDEGCGFAELQKGLRLFKCREILRIAARDLCGRASLMEVTAEISDLASSCLQRAVEHIEKNLRAEYGAPLAENGELAAFTVLAMGKFGGRELNFSSDVDLIYFYSHDLGRTQGVDDGLGGRKGRIPLHNYFIKLGEQLNKAIGEVTEDGFVFRVDLNLRPEGRSGPIAQSAASALFYYESWGRSWERAAMIKARPVAGSLELGEKFIKDLVPFVFRRNLDYAMVEDIKLMKQKIDHSLAHKQERDINLKLGRGGIREIEFFIQALQLIYGGRKLTLRGRSSLTTLALLREEGLIKPAEHDALCAAYIFLRTLEHRIQVVQERQTHLLPQKPAELRALARRCGFSTTAEFEKALEEHRSKVSSIYRDLFYTAEESIKEEVRPDVSFLFAPDADPDLVKDVLEEKGFKDPEGAYESLLMLREGHSHAPITERGRRILERLAPLLMQEVIDSPEPSMALLNLERFLGVLRARATFYALLADNRDIIRLLVSLFATSQFLSRIFVQHPEILDSLVSRSYAVFEKDRETMAEHLDALMRTGRDFEARLELLRVFRNEEFLRIALSDLSGQLGQGSGTRQLSELAEVCLHKAVEMAREEMLPRFGLPFTEREDGELREAPFAVQAMGKLGGGELNYHSDLDIIFIYEGAGNNRPVEGTEADRFKEQNNQEYFSRMAQRVISILSLSTRNGYVYQIDTRLRPSGNQGPLVTSLSAYAAYHESSAQLWERQALTKARVVVGPAELAEKIETLNQRIVYERQMDQVHARQEIRRLRGRMEEEIAKENATHFNIKTGRGGMVDVEFLVQYLQLLHGGANPRLRTSNSLQALSVMQEEGILEPAEAEGLAEGYKFLRRLENKLRLVHDQSVNQLEGDAATLGKLARRLGYAGGPKKPDQAFLEDYRRHTERIRTIFETHLGGG